MPAMFPNFGFEFGSISGSFVRVMLWRIGCRSPKPPQRALRNFNHRSLCGSEMRFSVAYRIRVADYRVVYTINDRVVLVIVIRVGHRRDIYMRRTDR